MTVENLAMRDSLLNSILQEMLIDEKIMFISSDFGSPVLDEMRKLHSDKFINVGVAEQNLINVSVGFALEGYKVFSYAIAPFISMRCLEQIRVSVCLLSETRPMNINLIGVGTGYSYTVSGPTHQCYEDLSIMRTLPNLKIFSPADQIVTSSLLNTCLENKKPKYIRLDAQKLPIIYDDKKFDIYQGYVKHSNNNDICIISTGIMVHKALEISKLFQENKNQIDVIDLFSITDFNRKLLSQDISDYKIIVSMEESFIGRGGLDSVVFNLMNEYELLSKPFFNLGLEPIYRYDLGTRDEIHQQLGLDTHSLAGKINNFLKKI